MGACAPTMFRLRNINSTKVARQIIKQFASAGNMYLVLAEYSLPHPSRITTIDSRVFISARSYASTHTPGAFHRAPEIRSYVLFAASMAIEIYFIVRENDLRHLSYRLALPRSTGVYVKVLVRVRKGPTEDMYGYPCYLFVVPVCAVRYLCYSFTDDDFLAIPHPMTVTLILYTREKIRKV
jgi:hypothetical protein